MRECYGLLHERRWAYLRILSFLIFLLPPLLGQVDFQILEDKGEKAFNNNNVSRNGLLFWPNIGH